MRVPRLVYSLFGRERPPLAAERMPLAESAWLNAMAAVAVGMFLGAWVIGPAISSGDPAEHARLRSAKLERESLQAAAARPDPSPYRTPTPDFDMPNAPHYGEFAKEQAQAAYGGRYGETQDAIAQSQTYDQTEQASYDSPWSGIGTTGAATSASSTRYRRVDRHSNVSSY